MAVLFLGCAFLVTTDGVEALLARQLRSGATELVVDPKSSPQQISELINYGNAQYTVSVMVGGQRLEMLPDTGSFSLMVTSTLCPKQECPRRAFVPERSKTYEDLHGNQSVHFGSGSVGLAKAQDEVTLGPFTEKNQVFWEINQMGPKMTAFFEVAAFDGVLGLGWGKEVPGSGEKSLLESLQIDAFTVCLGKRELGFGNYNDTGTPSKIYWGYPRELDGITFQESEVLGIQHWAVRLEHVAVEGGQAKPGGAPPGPFACAKEKCAAILDTGFSLIGVPAQHLGGLLGGLPRIMEDCSNYDQLPDITLYVGGAKLRLTPADYIRKVDFRGLKKNKAFWDKMTKKMQARGHKGVMEWTCEPGFIASAYSSQEGPVWILGQSFMQRHLVRFDRARKTIGLTEHPGICPDHHAEERKKTKTSLLKARARPSSGPIEPEKQRRPLPPPVAVDGAKLWPGSLMDL